MPSLSLEDRQRKWEEERAKFLQGKNPGWNWEKCLMMAAQLGREIDKAAERGVTHHAPANNGGS